MLQRLIVRNCRSLVQTTLELSPGLPTVVIGPNSSGKTTLIEALDIVQSVAASGVHTPLNQQRNGFLTVRTRGALTPLSLSLEFLKDQQTGASYILNLDGDSSGACWIAKEAVYAKKVERGNGRYKERSTLEFDATEKGVAVNEAESLRGVPRDGRVSNSVLSRFLFPDKFPAACLVAELLPTMRVYPSFLTLYRWAREDWRQDFGPRSSAVAGTTTSLLRQGSELPNVLHNLSIYHPRLFEFLVEQLRGEFPFVERLIFPPDPAGGRIAMGWMDSRFPGKPFFASEMSDGMAAFVCILAALVVPPGHSSVVALDEPDAHLHPSAIQRLVSVAGQTALHTPVLIVTHSNLVLDSLAEPAKSVRVCIPGPKGTEIRQLDERALTEWLADYTPSELRQRGLLDKSNRQD